MLDLNTSEQTLSKSKIKKLRKMGLIENDEYSLDNITKRIPKQPNTGLRLSQIKPKTANQSIIFQEYAAGKHLMLHGFAGTGKTFLSIFLALSEILEADSKYNKLIIVRSAVATRDIGFLPGNKEEKTAEYEAPYKQICSELFGRGDAYEILKKRGQIEFVPTSFIRGLTIDNAIVIVDEANNLTFHEADTVITRLGNTARIVFCGDYRQSDLRFKDEKIGFLNFMSILNKMKNFANVEMEIEDIVRSGLVKDYIITKDSLGL